MQNSFFVLLYLHYYPHLQPQQNKLYPASNNTMIIMTSIKSLGKNKDSNIPIAIRKKANPHILFMGVSHLLGQRMEIRYASISICRISECMTLAFSAYSSLSPLVIS